MYVRSHVHDVPDDHRRDLFFAEFVGPMINEAKAIGVSMTDVIAQIILWESTEDDQRPLIF